MSEKDPLFHNGHRDRLRQKFLDNGLSDAEVLELIIADIIPRRDVRPIARGLMERFGSLSQILATPLDELLTYKGIGKNTAVHIKLVYDIMMRAYKIQLREEKVFLNEVAFTNYCKYLVGEKTVEEFHVLYLDGDYRLMSVELHSRGTINWSAVYIREIVQHALTHMARAIVLLHNHPASGHTFSDDDVMITQTLINQLEPLGVYVYDHYLVAQGILYSMRNLHLLDKSK